MPDGAVPDGRMTGETMAGGRVPEDREGIRVERGDGGLAVVMPPAGNLWLIGLGLFAGVPWLLSFVVGGIAQTAPEQAPEATRDWRASLRARLADVDWDDVRRDVSPFLEQRRDVEVLTGATFAELLDG